MDLLDCSADMECTKLWTNEKLDPYKNTWSDGETTYFINKEDFFIQSNHSGNTVTISPNVENFIKTDDTLIYWLKNNQIIIKQGTQPPVTHTLEFPVYTVANVDGHIFAVTHNVKNNRLIVLDGTQEFKELFQLNLSPNESLASLQFTSNSDTQFRILLDTILITGGTAEKMIRDASFSVSSTRNDQPELTELMIHDQDTGRELFEIRNPRIYEGKSGTEITFSASSINEIGKKVNQVFVGSYEESLIEATAITKEGDFYVQPIILNDETIAYLKLIGNKKQLMYSSANDAKLAQSADGITGDAKKAFFSLVSLLFNGLVLLLLSFTWLIPSLGLGYGTLALLQNSRKSYAHITGFFVSLILLIPIQVLLFIKVFNPERIFLRSPYLTDNWHLATVIFIAGIVCLFPIMLTRKKVTEDNFNKMVLYTSGMNLLILLLLVGPYFI